MRDELTQCLAKLGQGIKIISPYYDANKDGKNNYLENDEMVLYNDIEVKMDKNYTFKIYFGKKIILNIISYIIKKYS